MDYFQGAFRGSQDIFTSKLSRAHEKNPRDLENGHEFCRNYTCKAAGHKKMFAADLPNSCLLVLQLTCPTAVFYSEEDKLSSVLDVLDLIDQLPNVVFTVR